MRESEMWQAGEAVRSLRPENWKQVDLLAVSKDHDRRQPVESYVRIFDTTLRDGEQSPGATMTSAEKLEVARALARLGVDIIEAGFPAASPDDLEAVRRIAVEVGNSRRRHSRRR